MALPEWAKALQVTVPHGRQGAVIIDATLREARGEP